MSKFKGLYFDSWNNPPIPWRGQLTNPTRSLPLGKQYLSHQGFRARLRQLRQACKPVLHAATPESLERVRISTSSEVHPEFAMLHLLFIAQNRADQSGAPIDIAISLLMDSLEKMINEPASKEAKHDSSS